MDAYVAGRKARKEIMYRKLRGQASTNEQAKVSPDVLYHMQRGMNLKDISKKAAQEVTVSRVPKVRQRQLEALKSRGIEGPTKTAFGVMPLAVGALMAPGAAKEMKGRMQATKGTGGAVLTPKQMQMRSLQMGVR